MKVLYTQYLNTFQSFGGAENRLLKTKEYVSKQGITTKLFNQWEDDLSDYDIVHHFGSGYFNYDFLVTVKNKGCKLAITPVYWTDEYLLKKIAFGVLSLMPFKTTYGLVKREFEIADVLFPNSEQAKQQISRLFKIEENKMSVVRNGVDEVFLKADRELFINRYGIKDFILVVGRFDPLQKNQLNFIKAFKKEKNIPIVFIGNPDAKDPGYYYLCKKEATKNMLFIDNIYDSKLLASAYASSEVVVMPSLYEYPGLVGLEATLAGAKVVMTEGGSVKEYYQDYVPYINPKDQKDMFNKIMSEYNKKNKVNVAFIKYIENNYLWDKIVDNNIAEYKRILSVD